MQCEISKIHPPSCSSTFDDHKVVWHISLVSPHVNKSLSDSSV